MFTIKYNNENKELESIVEVLNVIKGFRKKQLFYNQCIVIGLDTGKSLSINIYSENKCILLYKPAKKSEDMKISFNSSSNIKEKANPTIKSRGHYAFSFTEYNVIEFDEGINAIYTFLKEGNIENTIFWHSY